MIEGYPHDETETSMTGDPIDQGWLMNLMMVLMANWGFEARGIPMVFTLYV